LFKITTQVVSLWHFHVYMYYNPNWFISSFFFFYLCSLLIVISTGLKILYSFLYRKYIIQFTFWTSPFILPLLYVPSP
jgi:hypothetical protein